LDFLERPQEPHVILGEQVDVIDAVTNHRDAFDAEAEAPHGSDRALTIRLFAAIL
jgi:hypothetical protein